MDNLINFNKPQPAQPPKEGLVLIKKAGVTKMPSTKIELNHSKIARCQGDLDDLARILFPGNKNHQRVFLAIFIEIKYAPVGMLPTLAPLCYQYGFSPRMLETVRAKARRMGLIDHVSRFSKAYGYREGWVLSSRFSNALERLAGLIEGLKDRQDATQEKKDRDIFRYL
jgi:hypothetical protein